MHRVGLWLRTCAAAIDLIILTFLSIGVTIAVTFFHGAYTDDLEHEVDLATALAVLLYTTTEIFFAATPGKLILRLAIAAPQGISARRSLLSFRWSTKFFPLICGVLFLLTRFPIFYLLGGFTNLVVLVGCLFAANDDKQAWHDQWCHTAVYRRRDLAPAPYSDRVSP